MGAISLILLVFAFVFACIAGFTTQDRAKFIAFSLAAFYLAQILGDAAAALKTWH